MYWNWKWTYRNWFKCGILTLLIQFVLQNLQKLNNSFLPQISVGSILIFALGILILKHMYGIVMWWIKYFDRYHATNVIIDVCGYLTVFSIILSMPLHISEINPDNSNVNNQHNNLNLTPIPTVSISTPFAYKYDSSPKTVNFEYNLHGNNGKISYTVYGGMNDYLRSQPREISYEEGQSPPTDLEFIMKDLNNEEQKPLIDPLIWKIQNITSNKDDQARIAISLVQNINYDWEGFKTGNINGKYPYEVLYTGSGVCSEKSELLAYMLRKLDYGVALLRFNVGAGHDAVGIKCPQPYSYRNSGYCFVESTVPTIITDSSGDYVGLGKLTSVPKILKISDGSSFDSVSEEFNDAVAWNSISNMGKALDEYNYNRWLSLANKYGINTTKN